MMSYENFDPGALQGKETPSLLIDDKEKAEVRMFFESRFGHLDPEQRQKAEAKFYSHNLCDFSRLAFIGEERAFTMDELQEFRTCLMFEEFSGNEAAQDSARDILKLQKTFAAGMAANDKKPPETLKEFEQFLKDAGYSNRIAKKIAAEGFKA